MRFAIPILCLAFLAGCAKPYTAGKVSEQSVTPPTVDLSGGFKGGPISTRENDCTAIAVTQCAGFNLGKEIRAEELSQSGRIWPSLALGEALGKGWLHYQSVPKGSICAILDSGRPVVVAVQLPQGKHTAIVCGYGFLYFVVRDSYIGPRWYASSPEWNAAIMGAWRIDP